MTATSTIQHRSERVADQNAIRPFHVNVPDAELTELRRRIKATRWPERETVADASQGVQLATMQKLARYWATDYDWRKVEARLNALPQFITEIDGLDIHFIHVRSKHENALPLIVTHGWPGSIIEQLKIIDPLDQSHGAWRKRIGRFPSGDSVDAGLRVFRQADHDRLGPRPHRARLDRADEAPRIHAIRGARRRLGCGRHGPDGAYRRLRNCSAFTPTCLAPFQPTLRRRLQCGDPPPSGLSAEERRAYEQLKTSIRDGRRLRASRWRHRPQTLYGIADSPVGLAAWMLDHDARSYELIARVFDGQPDGPYARRRPRQHHALLVDEHGGLFGSSLLGKQVAASSTPKNVSIPVAVSVFPDELYAAPRSWAERAYPKLIHYNKLDKGGHFAAWEQPELFVEELRAGFKSLR